MVSMSHTDRTFSFVKKSLLLFVGLTLLVPAPFATNRSATYAKAADKDQIIVSPTPQHMQINGEGFPLTPVVGLVTGEQTDPAAIDQVMNTLHAADVKRIVRKDDGTNPHTPVTIWMGTPSDNPGMKAALEDLDVQGPEDLKKEGYVFASGEGKDGDKQIVLAGKDAIGTFYAAQTFDQVIASHPGRDRVPSVNVRDWPDMALRGTIEGFYGKPWSHEDRLNQMDFYGKNKMNTYVYAPKDDPYHRDKWREPYPEQRLEQLKELVQKAKQNHVQFVFGLSPGTSVCYSGDDDFEKLMDKMQTMYDLGVRSYAIFLDDISRDLRCEQDKQKFGDQPSPAAAAQAYLLNRFQKEFIETHEGTNRLITVPTDYAGTANTVYQQQFADLVDQDIIVDWTGPEVVSKEITAEQTEKAWKIFKHDLLIWDNYPVNDYATDRLFLGPLVNRDPNLTDHGVLGITANPMNQAEASKIPLYTQADYMWNPEAYHPRESWERSIQALGGDAADALKTFAENSYSFADLPESPTLSPLIDGFWKAYETGDLDQASDKLLKEFKNIEQAPQQLRENLDNQNFLTETRAWLDKLETYGKAGQAAVNMLKAQYDQNSEQADHYRSVLDDVLKNDTTDIVIPETKQATRKLDGVNRYRGESELIQYTPEYGDRTGTNQWGYEITVVDGKVVKMGGNNSPIPDDGYVLSIHASNWLRDNAMIGADVQIENGEVTLTIPKGTYTVPNDKAMAPGVIQPFLEKAKMIQETTSADDMKPLVDQFNKEGEFSGDDAVRSLQIHLTAVSHYEDKNMADKVVKHLNGLKTLLDHQKKNEQISEKAYDILKTATEMLIRKWQ
jgi:hyaluronoglucosaminidase